MSKSKSLSWSELDGKLQPWLSEAISSLGFTEMTPVQASTIPLFLQNKDVIVEAVTGSGKTLSFVIPILNKIKEMKKSQKSFNVVVISPTRELSMQIDKVFESILKFNPEENIRTQVVVGGVQSLQDDLRMFHLTKPQIIIATPGRFAEFINHEKYVTVKDVEIMILDEADKLLDLNFNKEMIKIFDALPKQKRVGLFSATILNASDNFHKTGMRNPIKIIVNAKNHKPNSLKLQYLITTPEKKIQTLFKIISTFHFRKSIVYFPTCLSVDYFYSMFKAIDHDFKFFSLHGKLKTQNRIKTLKSFEESTHHKSILMTTDVAARGIDIENVDLVIQLDPPTDPDVFLHRCGRTGRANNVGQAIVLLNEGREEDYVDFLSVKKTELEELKLSKNTDNEFEDIPKQVKTWMIEDRLKHDKAVRAYVSFVQYYSKHTASSIFRLSELDYVSLGKMYGLLRLPAMPEINKYVKDVKDGIISDFDMNKYKYKDPVKEEERIKELNKETKRQLKKQQKETIAWSKKKDAKEIRNAKTILKDVKKRDLELKEGESDEETDWKDLVRQNKRKKQDTEIARFDDL